MKHIATLHTIGDGYWSRAERRVNITKVELPHVNDKRTYGELCVYFDRKSWDPGELGLIYTDTLFQFETKVWLKTLGYDSSDVGYSEQGMQGDDYVSFDVGKKFIKSWINKSKESSNG